MKTSNNPAALTRERAVTKGMKALTARQPWATLLVIGAKSNETRSWYTKYRGPVAIHAGAHPLRDTLAQLPSNVVGCMKLMLRGKRPEGMGRLDIHRLPLGCIVGTANLVDCVRIDKAFVDSLDEYERMFGDYTIGRYAWIFENPIAFKKPIYVKGAQGLWTWEKGRRRTG